MVERGSIKNKAISKAEEQFAKIMKQDAVVLSGREKAKQEKAKKTARLRALRLTKKVSD